MSGHLPSVWAFLANATYAGKDIFQGIDIDLWDASSGGVQIRLGVRQDELWRPAFLERRGYGRRYIYVCVCECLCVLFDVSCIVVIS